MAATPHAIPLSRPYRSRTSHSEPRPVRRARPRSATTLASRSTGNTASETPVRVWHRVIMLLALLCTGIDLGS